MTIEIKVKDGTNVGALLESIAGGLSDVMGKRVLQAADYVAGEIRREVNSTFPEGRTGALARSFTATFLGWNGDVVGAEAGSELIYAKVQNDGQTITAKTTKSLAVPIPGANIPIGKWPRHYPKDKLVFIKIGGNAILWSKSGGGRTKKGKEKWTTLTPLFVLKKSVTIRGKKYVDSAVNRAADDAQEIIRTGVINLVEEDAEG